MVSLVKRQLKKQILDSVFIVLTFWLLFSKAPVQYFLHGTCKEVLFFWIIGALSIGVRELYDVFTDYVTDPVRAKVLRYIVTIFALILILTVAFCLF